MRNGFRVIDTDCHQMEPPSIWADYIDPTFADRAPRIGDIGHGRKGIVVEGEALTRQTGSYPMDSDGVHRGNGARDEALREDAQQPASARRAVSRTWTRRASTRR